MYFALSVYDTPSHDVGMIMLAEDQTNLASRSEGPLRGCVTYLSRNHDSQSISEIETGHNDARPGPGLRVCRLENFVASAFESK